MVQADLAGCRSQDIDHVASSFLANTEIGAGMGPFYKLHAVAYAVAAVPRSLAWVAAHFVDPDSSFPP